MNNTISSKFEEKIILLKLKALRDPDTYAKIYDLYLDRIYRFVYIKVSIKEDAQDITSEVFLKVWQYIHENKPIKNFNALIYATARNAVIDYYRRRNNKPISLDKVSGLAEIGLSDKNIIDQVEFSRLLHIINKLKDEYKEVILLRYVEGYSVREVSNIMNKTSGNIKVLIHRAKKCVSNLYGEAK